MFSVYILTSVDHVTVTLTLPRGVGLGLGLGTLPVLLSGEQVLQVDMLFIMLIVIMSCYYLDLWSSSSAYYLQPATHSTIHSMHLHVKSSYLFMFSLLVGEEIPSVFSLLE